MARPLHLLLVCVLLVGAGGGVGCRDKEAARRTADRRTLEVVVDGDRDLDRAMKEADDLSAAGNDARAADLLEQRAIPTAERALHQAETAELATPWANERRAELVTLLRDRRAELPRYAAALRGRELEPRIAALEAQVALTRRALAVVQQVQAGPDAGSR